MRRQVCTFVVRNLRRQVFSRRGPYFTGQIFALEVHGHRLHIPIRQGFAYNIWLLNNIFDFFHTLAMPIFYFEWVTPLDLLSVPLFVVMC